LIEYYEKIREAVFVHDCSGSSRWGQALLVNRGVVAWMQAAGQLLASLSPLLTTATVTGATLPSLVRQDLVHLMGEVVLTVAQKAEAL
jgi:hypothetical protein